MSIFEESNWTASAADPLLPGDDELERLMTDDMAEELGDGFELRGEGEGKVVGINFGVFGEEERLVDRWRLMVGDGPVRLLVEGGSAGKFCL